MPNTQPRRPAGDLSILEQASKELEQQEQNTFRAGAVVDHGKVGVETGIKGAIGRGWNLGAWMRWWRGEKTPAAGVGVEKRW